MKIIELNNKLDYQINWEKTFPGDFLQSWNWGEIQKKNSFQVLRYKIVDRGVFTVVVKPLFFGLKYWYISRGPLASIPFTEEESLEFLKLLKAEAKKDQALFIRLEPSFAWPSNFKKFFASDVQPRQTLILDLKKDQELLLSEMGQKTRYNIRLAAKKSLVFKNDKKYFSEFWNLMKETSQRDDFRGHSESYYNNLLSSDNTYLLTVFSNNKVVAAGIFAKFGPGFYYLHGASNYSQRQLMAPYFLQWQAISLAKESGSLFYDFYGIDEKKWPGVTRFKLAFGGERLVYNSIADIAIYPFLYKLYLMFRKIYDRSRKFL